MRKENMGNGNSRIPSKKVFRWLVCLGLPLVLLIVGYVEVRATLLDMTVVGEMHESQAEHVSQAELLALVQAGEFDEAFEQAFEEGDELFETTFNALDGGGANVGNGQRFTRLPRADLDGPDEWLNHFPPRPTGPNAEACNDCHNAPFDDGAGKAGLNVIRDPFQSGDISSFINRNTPHVFAPGAIQRLAEEMTDELHQIQAAAMTEACNTGQPVTAALIAKGVDFGTLVVPSCGADPDTSGVVGINTDLVVRPFQWKGDTAALRFFNRDASNNELGMQAVEVVGDDVDGDYDGIVNEMTIGDQTALAIYLAAQPRPTTLVELATWGLIEPLPADQLQAITDGEATFAAIGCGSCHVPELLIDVPIFSEPSQSLFYRDTIFPGGQDPVASGVDPAFPIAFDLTQHQPDNVVFDEFGHVVYRLGSFLADAQGRAIVQLYGDLKRHDMGPEMAESVDEIGTGASVFLTENLWGVGSTAPYLHDGRATTLAEAILEHGGEAAGSRDNFLALTTAERTNLIAFLENLVLFKAEEEEAPHLDCVVTYQLVSVWGSGFTANVKITNNSADTLYGWSLNWGFDGNQTVTNSWNASAVQQSGNRVLATALPNFYNGTINPNGGSVTFGFQAAYSGANQIPTEFILNGAACSN